MKNTPEPKTILSMDCAMAGVSVGVVAENGHVVSRMFETTRGQASLLVPTIQEVLNEADITFQDLDLIVSTMGPGSFTGLRIGLSTARSLALALDIPVVGISTLDVMARHYEGDKPLLIVLETKRQDFYGAYYDVTHGRLSDSLAARAEDILAQAPAGDFAVGGDCLDRFKDHVDAQTLQRIEFLDEWIHPDPILMVQTGKAQFMRDGDLGAPQPVYLRGADVSKPKHAPRQLEEVGNETNM